MNRRFVLELVSLFQKHHLIDKVDDSKIDAAVDAPVLGNIVEQVLPDRVLVYDSECIESGEGFTRLVKRYAELTKGEWDPANIQSTFNWEEGSAVVEFDYRQEHFRWELEQHGDYVGSDFLKTIGEFFESFLGATLINLHFLSQEIYVLYLPKSIAAEFHRLVNDFTPSSDEVATLVRTVDDWSQKGLTGWYLVKDVLSQHNLSSINQPTRDGDLVLSIVLGKVKQGSSQARELVSFLVGFGADPQRLDKESLQYWRSGMR